jgi:hypothetical protein
MMAAKVMAVKVVKALESAHMFFTPVLIKMLTFLIFYYYYRMTII